MILSQLLFCLLVVFQGAQGLPNFARNGIFPRDGICDSETIKFEECVNHGCSSSLDACRETCKKLGSGFFSFYKAGDMKPGKYSVGTNLCACKNSCDVMDDSEDLPYISDRTESQTTETRLVGVSGYKQHKQHQWCNRDKVYISNFMSSGKRDCISRCVSALDCYWVGYRVNDNYCELWGQGSCVTPHAQQNHDIYQVRDSAARPGPVVMSSTHTVCPSGTDLQTMEECQAFNGPGAGTWKGDLSGFPGHVAVHPRGCWVWSDLNRHWIQPDGVIRTEAHSKPICYGTPVSPIGRRLLSKQDN